jgi:CheY-like chemotaxis protein
MRILIVDDEAAVANLLADAIQMQGHETTVVHDGPEALARLAERAYDAVFLDVLMPEMSGVEVLRRIRAIQPTLPVIVITGHARPEDLDEVRRLGVSEVIEKPFILTNLGDALGGLRKAP